MNPRALAAALVVLITTPNLAYADGGTAKRFQGPCAGCLASLPPGSDARPLLVLLHGDGETASSMLDAWEAGAASRGIVVFAPTCPKSEGCSSQSWWKWDGPPSWLLHQIDELAETRPIERERMWLAGWSGGATYVGWNTQELERTFAALVIHGGGVRPRRSTCADPKAAIYFLGGDKNLLHDLAEQLHDYYVRCDYDDLTWTVLKGADHEGERRALSSRRASILDWLETKRRTRRPDTLPPEAGTATALAPSAQPSEPPLPPSTSLPPTSCRCVAAGVASDDRESGGRGLALLVAIGVAAVSRIRGRAVSRRSPGSAPGPGGSGSCAPGPRRP